MKKICFNLLLLVVLSGCFQTTAMVGPTMTLVSTGNVGEALGAFATNKAVEEETGMQTHEFIAKKVKKKSRVKKEVPYNYESGHIQFFTLSSLENVVNEAGYELTAVRNGSVMGADLSGATILKFKVLIKLNTKIADYLPSWAAATWHFVLSVQQG